MPDLIEVRCVCRQGAKRKHPLLCKIGGENFQLEIVCRHCGKRVSMKYPDPLAQKKPETPGRCIP